MILSTGRSQNSYYTSTYCSCSPGSHYRTNKVVPLAHFLNGAHQRDTSAEEKKRKKRAELLSLKIDLEENKGVSFCHIILYIYTAILFSDILYQYNL